MNLKEAISKTESLDAQKSDIRLIERVTEQWIGRAQKSTVNSISKSGKTQRKFSRLIPRGLA
jgi:hypothetical protein